MAGDCRNCVWSRDRPERRSGLVWQYGMESRAALGNTVSFVLGFNFLAGFIYALAGAGLLLRRRWAVYAALFVAVSTVFVFVAFGVHIIGGEAFEMRTLGAMMIRSIFWIAVAIVSWRALERTPASGP